MPQGIPTSNMKALALMVPKLWPRLKFLKSRSKVKVKVTRPKMRVPLERLALGNAYIKYESHNSYGSQVMAKVKVFEK